MARFHLVAFGDWEVLEGVPVEEQIDRAREEFAARLDRLGLSGRSEGGVG